MKSSVLVLLAIVLALVVYYAIGETTDLGNGARARLALLTGPAVGWGAWWLLEHRARKRAAREDRIGFL